MRIVAISDSHKQHRGTRLKLPPGDILIHAGDSTNDGSLGEFRSFIDWFARQDFKHKILIAGNHDACLQHNKNVTAPMIEDFCYLEGDMVEIEGLMIYGSPWTPAFGRMAFMAERNGEDLRHEWDIMPQALDILITHGPPHGILDTTSEGVHIGDELLRERIKTALPKKHIFGHCHESYGKYSTADTDFYNVSVCNEWLEPVNKPTVIDL